VPIIEFACMRAYADDRRTQGMHSMGCLIALIALFSPRLALFLVWLFSDLLSRAFDGFVVPLLGFFLLPWTTLVYALVYSSSNRVDGFEWFLVAIAFLIDLGAYSGGEHSRRQR
jgi:hypothetical protein